MRPISSKWDRSELMPSVSAYEEEWKEDDLEDLELVSSGGEPGACTNVVISSCDICNGSVNARRRVEVVFVLVADQTGRCSGNWCSVNPYLLMVGRSGNGSSDPSGVAKEIY